MLPSIKKELELLCIGNVMVDVFAEVGDNEATRCGLNEQVQHIEMERLKGILRTLEEAGTRLITTSGGGAANVAKIAGYLGAKVAFTGATGSCFDHFAKVFESGLISAGVKPKLAQKNLPTGICLMLRSGGETRIAASPSAALELTESDISEEDIQRAKVVVIDGFMLGRLSLVRHILTLAERFGTLAAIDLASPAIAREHAEDMTCYARRYPLFLFMNEEEDASFREGLGLENKAEAPFPIWKDENFPIIVVKLGPRGALCYSGKNVYRSETRAQTSVETTGAGDAFMAAFLTAWVRNKSLSECAAMGNSAAGIVLGAMGTKVDGKAQEDLARLMPLTAKKRTVRGKPGQPFQ